MQIAKVFQSGNSQAIRIPKEMKTTKKEFIIRRINDCYFLIPADDPWALLRQTLGSESDEFTFERDQPLLDEVNAREDF